MAIEVNTAGVRRGLGSVYPDRGFLEACIAEGIPVTLGSDAHTPADVGRDYDAAFRLLQDMGIKEVALYDGRRLARKPLGAWLDNA
jgi:histidinol-phosphatase (PHP family)